MSSTPDTDKLANNDKPGSPVRRGPRQKKAAVVTAPDTIKLPIELVIPLGLAAYMSQFAGRTFSVEEIVQEAVIRHLDYLQKHGPIKLELPTTMLANLTRYKESLAGGSPSE